LQLSTRSLSPSLSPGGRSREKKGRVRVILRRTFKDDKIKSCFDTAHSHPANCSHLPDPRDGSIDFLLIERARIEDFVELVVTKLARKLLPPL
jgi:hypothetical protein